MKKQRNEERTEESSSRYACELKKEDKEQQRKGK